MNSTDLPILYSFRRCPYAMRARLALKYAGQTVRLREVVLRAKPAHLLSISPKGTVPVLLLSDGTVIEQSLDIMHWACTQHDPDGWLMQAGEAAARNWLSLNDGPFKVMLDRYKYADRHPEKSAEAWRDEALALMLQPMDEVLQREPYLMGAQLSLIDMALMPFVRQFSQVESSWFTQTPLLGVQRWLNHLLRMPLFESVMAKYEPWIEGGDEPLF
ncbi:MAG TPA: glutathione S-transferase [Aquabacterium sp.]|nr:glutathione S-transferase [Aquabacterium sp.]